MNSETEELETVLKEDGSPVIIENVVGVCRIDTENWLKFTE